MIIELDMQSSTPIYLQLRNRIVTGIGRGELAAGESLPTVRALSAEIGVNAMTVNKAYQMLKQEGYIVIDRRHGAAVTPFRETASAETKEKLSGELTLLSAEARVNGMDRMEFLRLCDSAFAGMAV